MTTDKSDLLRKYNIPAPRYTSYPTVPYWEHNPSEEEWLQHLRGSLSDAKVNGLGAALYLHIPFCEQLCTFCGCNTRITRNHGVSAPYIETLLKEWDLYQKKLSDFMPLRVSEIHLGGGTPTFLTPAELRLLLTPILKSVEFTEDREFSIEIDPRVTRPDHLETLADLGFRRISMGIQDFDPEVQAVVNRTQSFELVSQVVSSARAHGFKSLNFDLIYGLPKQTLASVEDTFAKVLTLKPDRIAFYAYAHVPWIKPTQRRFTEADLPNPELKRSLYERGRELLEANGYIEIGMDHFALRSDSLWGAIEKGTLHRNFMGYLARHVSPLIGLGVSSISDSWSAFIQNEKVLEKYRYLVESGRLPILRGHLLSAEDIVMRRHILNLMTRFETSWDEEAAWHPYLGDLSERLNELSRDGLVELSDKALKISEKGRPFIRNVSMAFDARLARSSPGTNLFSKSI